MIFIPKLFRDRTLQWIIQEAHSFRKTRVSVPHRRDVTWTNVDIHNEHEIARIFLDKPLAVKVAATIGRPYCSLERGQIWVHLYQKGEFIPPHRDGVGTCQLLLCLEAVCAPRSGRLFLTIDNHTIEYELAPGDVVLFNAVQHLHYTNPILRDANSMHPKRTVLICRYFFADDRTS
jgi:hypothetical protein